MYIRFVLYHLSGRHAVRQPTDQHLNPLKISDVKTRP